MNHPHSAWEARPDEFRVSRFLLTRNRRSEFEVAVSTTLLARKKAFDQFAELPDGDRESLSDWAGTKVAAVVRYDALRDTATRALQTTARLPAAVAVLACLATPFFVSAEPAWADLLTALVGALIAVATLFLVALGMRAIDLLTGRPVADTTLGYLCLAAALASALWIVLRERPWGYEAYGAALVGQAVFWSFAFLLSISIRLTHAVVGRLKLAANLDGEIVESILGILHKTYIEPSADRRAVARFDYAARELQYLARIIDQRWRQLLPKGSGTGAGSRWHSTVNQVAGGLRDLSMRAAFANERLEAELSSKLAADLSAFVSGNYGNLLVGEPENMSVRPRLRRLLGAAGSLAAAVLPLVALLLLPELLGITLDDKLFGTLLTATLAWLSLYAVSWLDPKATEHAKSLGPLVNAIGSGKRTN
ncbi:hypothetical protein [Paractinoplanes rishiriensis]|uniref:Uncharacterized protein n=1 Tax=Paractinoplanes rishiriensis TaxID=1050105 RepID=A0A919K703_9ACTN|nr:hypothetical protein [Actinoplanes rishiriensis]GIF00076.1 hypothetical protein Ari01nite_75400 [Actinoplanes rishiriensis]